MRKKDETKRNNSVIVTTIECLKTIFIAIIISYTILAFFRFSVVDGESMSPTLSDGEKLLMSVTAYKMNAPERGDIIVAIPEEFGGKTYIIKRIIAIPGDTVEIKDGIIYVNDVALEETYVKEEMITADIERFRLEADEYFICGDNRNNSLDSRSEIIGNVTKKEIMGKIIFNFSSFGFIKN